MQESTKMINKLLKLTYVIVAVGLLFTQYASATPADDDLTPLSRSEYFVPAPLAPQLSSDGKTLYNAVPPVVYVADPNPSHEPLRIQAPFDLLTLPPEFATANFSITYVLDGVQDAFGNNCYTFPDDAKTAFNAAANIWANLIQSSVPITIRVCWATLGSGILGQSGGGPLHSDFLNAPLANTWYMGSLANALAGYDLRTDLFDMHITHSLLFSWYYGTDGNPQQSQVDLMSVALHEIAHGLGFSGSMFYSSTTGQWSWGYGYGIPNIYDTFMRDGTGNPGNQLINTGVYPNPSTALGTALTSDNIYFHGSNAMAANGGQRVKIYAPTTWAGGSSYSHLDYNTFNNTPNQLMVWAISAGESVHDPGPVTIGILEDLGWTTFTSPPPCTYLIDPANSSLFSPSGGTGSLYITTQPGCTWTAMESLGWVDITSGTGGSGSGTVNYTISSNGGAERSGTITISGMAFTGTHTITQAGTGATNLLQNPDFESGNTVWLQESSPSYPYYVIIITSTSQISIPVHSGSWAAWFGGYPGANDVLSQQVTIPSWACQAYVQFWYYIEDGWISGQNDILSVEIRRNSDNALLKTLKTFSNLDSSGWVQSQQFDVTEFMGQTVRLRFAATTNAPNDTSFFIDDVTLMVVTSTGNVYVSLYDSMCAGKSPCYSSIQSAINGANTCTVINATWDTYNENVVLNIPKTFILQGGWDSTFMTIQSNTTIRSLNITDGKLTVGNFILN
jgi:hypothetical protein